MNHTTKQDLAYDQTGNICSINLSDYIISNSMLQFKTENNKYIWGKIALLKTDYEKYKNQEWQFSEKFECDIIYIPCENSIQ